MSYTVGITQKFPKSKRWTFGPYDTPEEAAKEAEEHCILIGAKIVGSDQFEFRYEDMFLSVNFIYVAVGTSFNGVEGFSISIDKLDTNIGIEKQGYFQGTPQCYGFIDKLAQSKKRLEDIQNRRKIASSDFEAEIKKLAGDTDD